VIARWVRFWNRREAPCSLALVRILVALSLLGDLLDAAAREAVLAVWAPPPFGAGWGQEQSPAPLIVQWFGASTQTALLTWSAATIACLLVLFGVAYRASSWLLVFAMIELTGLMPNGDGIDALFCIVLPLLALSQANACWSFDAWLARRLGKPMPQAVLAWPRYLLVVQLLWLYFSAAHHRSSASWRPSGGFSAVADVMGHPHFARFSPGTPQAAYPITQLATALTMLFEGTAPLLLLWTWLDRRPGRGGKFGHIVRFLRIRWLSLALGAGLHVGIAVTMQLGMFPFGMLALYPAFFHPEEIARAVAYLRRGRLIAFAHTDRSDP
jgi:hypothetical protein